MLLVQFCQSEAALQVRERRRFECLPRPFKATLDYVLVCVLLLGLTSPGRNFLVTHDLASIGWMWLVPSTAHGVALYEVPRFQIRRAMKANPCLPGEILLLLNHEATEFSYATGRSKLQWRAYMKIQRDTASARALLYRPLDLPPFPKE